MSLWAEIRSFWDEDAATYDRSGSHNPLSPAERAAWFRAVEVALPPPPASVLDVGAGTGFLSLQAAELGHQVTAVDIAPAMLARLRSKADEAGVSIETQEANADRPPQGPFDVVIERHLLWTLPDPVGSLIAWRQVAPKGRLVLFESLWGQGSGQLEQLRAKAHSQLRRLRNTPPDHHGSYPVEVRSALPFGNGPKVQDLISAVEAAGWHSPRLIRLRDVEWAKRRQQQFPERLMGVAPWFTILASSEPSAG